MPNDKPQITFTFIFGFILICSTTAFGETNIYGENGKISIEDIGDGDFFKYEYNNNGTLKSKTYYSDNGNYIENIKVYNYQDNNLISEIEYYENQITSSTYYNYDNNNNLVNEQSYYDGDKTTGTLSYSLNYEYDNMNNRYHWSGEEQYYIEKFDNNGNIISQLSYLSTNGKFNGAEIDKLVEEITWQYDKNGNIEAIQAKNEDGSLKWNDKYNNIYDEYNNLIYVDRVYSYPGASINTTSSWSNNWIDPKWKEKNSQTKRISYTIQEANEATPNPKGIYSVKLTW